MMIACFIAASTLSNPVSKNPIDSAVTFVKPPEPFWLSVEIGPINDPTMIHRPQHLNRLFGHLDLPVVPARHLTGMHHHRQGTDGIDLVVLNLEVDWHRRPA